jgi:uncharacterized membrane protein
MQGIVKLRLALTVLVLALAPLAAPLLAATHPVTALLIRSFFSRLCHQDPGRSFVIAGSPVAVCVRCLGIYCGVALGMFLRMGKVSAFRLLAVAMLVNLVDVGSGMLHWHGNMQATRFWVGLLLGAAAGSILFLESLRPNATRPGRLPGLR